ncbi:MAG: tetratricopeptide repeat protein [Candidatus Muiribacteriota bacterium]
MKNFFIFLILFSTIITYGLRVSNELEGYFPEKHVPKDLQKIILNETEKVISERMHQYMSSNFNLIQEDSSIFTRLWQSTGPLIHYFGLKYDNIKIHVVETDDYILLSLPSGDIFFSEGLFYSLASEDEVSFLIGRQLYLIKNELGPSLIKNEKIKDYAEENKSVVDEYFLSVGQTDNIEADKNSAYALFKTGTSPWNALEYLKKLRKVDKEKIFYFDVDNLENRIEALQRYIDKAMPFSHIKVEKVTNYRNAYYYFVLGTKFLKGNMLDDAIKAFKTSVSIRDNIAETHNNLGVAYARRNFYNQAIYHYDIALRLQKDSRYYFNHAVSSIKLGNYDRALTYLKRAINHDPSNIRAQKLLRSLENFMEDLNKI